MCVKESEIEWWWETDRYDVPLSGVARVNGRWVYITELISEWGCWFDNNDKEVDLEYAAKPIWFMSYWRLSRWLFKVMVEERGHKTWQFRLYYRIVRHVF